MKEKPSKQLAKKQGQREKKKTYKVRNWKEYNQALVNRGKVEFWITEEALKAWENQKKTGKRGKPKLYSNIAIEASLMVGQVFHLPLRQTEGFVASILQKLDSSLSVPDYSTLSLRQALLPIQIRVCKISNEPLRIAVDSTGAKVYGEGEWKVRQHGWSKHRTWKKLHVGIDEATGDIVVGAVTGNDISDSEMLQPLLRQIPDDQLIDRVDADGAYDRRACYQTLKERNVTCIAIPPQHNAKIWQHGNSRQDRLARDENLRRIRAVGRKRWKEESGYHARSLAEVTMFRLKTIFTDRVPGRLFSSQRVQLLLRCKALNMMTAMGMPDSYLVA